MRATGRWVFPGAAATEAPVISQLSSAQSYDPIEGGAQLVTEITIEREGADKPACIAEAVARRYW